MGRRKRKRSSSDGEEIGSYIWSKLPGCRVLWPVEVMSHIDKHITVYCKCDDSEFTVPESEAVTLLPQYEAIRKKGIEGLKNMKKTLAAFKSDCSWAKGNCRCGYSQPKKKTGAGIDLPDKSSVSTTLMKLKALSTPSQHAEGKLVPKGDCMVEPTQPLVKVPTSSLTQSKALSATSRHAPDYKPFPKEAGDSLELPDASPMEDSEEPTQPLVKVPTSSLTQSKALSTTSRQAPDYKPLPKDLGDSMELPDASPMEEEPTQPSVKVPTSSLTEPKALSAISRHAPDYKPLPKEQGDSMELPVALVEEEPTEPLFKVPISSLTQPKALSATSRHAPDYKPLPKEQGDSMELPDASPMEDSEEPTQPLVKVPTSSLTQPKALSATSRHAPDYKPLPKDQGDFIELPDTSPFEEEPTQPLVKVPTSSLTQLKALSATSRHAPDYKPLPKDLGDSMELPVALVEEEPTQPLVKVTTSSLTEPKALSATSRHAPDYKPLPKEQGDSMELPVALVEEEPTQPLVKVTTSSLTEPKALSATSRHAPDYKPLPKEQGDSMELPLALVEEEPTQPLVKVTTSSLTEPKALSATSRHAPDYKPLSKEQGDFKELPDASPFEKEPTQPLVKVPTSSLTQPKALSATSRHAPDYKPLPKDPGDFMELPDTSPFEEEPTQPLVKVPISSLTQPKALSAASTHAPDYKPLPKEQDCMELPDTSPVTIQPLVKVPTTPTEPEEGDLIFTLDYLKVRDYCKRSRGAVNDITELTRFERRLLETQDVMEVRGKTGRGVPIILPPEIQKTMDFLSNSVVRQKCGIKSPYLFARKGDGTVRAYDALHKTATSAGIEEPSKVTSTQLRKYIATITQVLDLKENQLNWVLNHMGHTLDVHKIHYRATSDVIERTQIAKILLIQDHSRMKEFANRKLEDIQMDELLLEAKERSEQDITGGELEELLDKAEKFFDEEVAEEDEAKKARSHLTRKTWSKEEEEEIKAEFRENFDRLCRPKVKAVERCLRKSKKRGGTLHLRTKETLKKKIFRMIDAELRKTADCNDQHK